VQAELSCNTSLCEFFGPLIVRGNQPLCDIPRRNTVKVRKSSWPIRPANLNACCTWVDGRELVARNGRARCEGGQGTSGCAAGSRINNSGRMKQSIKIVSPGLQRAHARHSPVLSAHSSDRTLSLADCYRSLTEPTDLPTAESQGQVAEAI